MEEQIRIERLSYGSAGIGHTKAGKTVFVDKVSPGDLVDIVIKENKPRFCSGEVLRLVESSGSRVSPPCPYYDTCGACPWLHIEYSVQLEAKRDNVVSALVHSAHFDQAAAEALVAPILPSKRTLGYRNKLELGASYSKQNEFLLGFRKEGSHILTSPDSCLIVHKASEKAPKALRGVLRYLHGTQSLGIFRVGVRHSMRTNDMEIALWTSPGPFPRKMVAQTLKSTLRSTSIVRVVSDPGKARAVKQVEVLDGKGYWEEKFADSVFKTSAPSFFQVNTAQAEVMVAEVLAGLSLDPQSIVADLYAGGGTFSIALAKRAGTVIAVESASSSVKDLRRNADLNQVDIKVVGGDSARELLHLRNLDALVVDPPRSGLDHSVVKGIAATRPKQLAYVSCNPSTWARDIARFQEEGYALTHAQPVDLFPQTYHIEVVSILEAVKSPSRKV